VSITVNETTNRLVVSGDNPPRLAVTQIVPRVTASSSGPQGKPGPPGHAGEALTLTAGVDLSGHRVVTRRADGAAVYADNATVAHVEAPLWLTLSSAATGTSFTAQSVGIVDEPSWSWTPGGPLFLGQNGVLTQVVPSQGNGAVFLVQIGYATSATSITLDRQPSIVLSSGSGTGDGSWSDATTTSKGVVQLAGDLGGTASNPTVPLVHEHYGYLVQEIVDRRVADGRLQVAIDKRYRFNPAVGIPEADLSSGVQAKLNPSSSGSAGGSGGALPRLAVGDRHIAEDAGIAESKLALATDAHPAVGSRRTLGTGSRQAMPGNTAIPVVGTDVPPLVSGLVPAGYLPDGSVAGAPLDTITKPSALGVPTAGVNVRSSPADHVHPRGAGTNAGDHGLIAWSMDPASAASSQVATIGTLQLVRLYVPVPCTVTGIILSAVTAGSGLTNCFTALFDASRNLLGQSANLATLWGSTSGDKKGDLASPVSIATPGYVLAGFWQGGGTSPAWARGTALTGTLNNWNLTGSNLRFATSNTGLSTTAPSTAAALTATTTSYLVGLY
jgi:hypothetical protein